MGLIRHRYVVYILTLFSFALLMMFASDQLQPRQQEVLRLPFATGHIPPAALQDQPGGQRAPISGHVVRLRGRHGPFEHFSGGEIAPAVPADHAAQSLTPQVKSVNGAPAEARQQMPPEPAVESGPAGRTADAGSPAVRPGGVSSHLPDAIASMASLLRSGATRFLQMHTAETAWRKGRALASVAPSNADRATNRFTPPRELLVHLDLKGAPPKVSYLSQLIAMVARLGATGLLIEWEDKFPYSGLLQPVVAGNAYSPAEVRQILAAARAHNLTVMPLVQTFGHVEFVLKLQQFAHLREDPDSPQALCPSRNESATLVEAMIDQVMALHEDSRRVHIGSDEVFVLGRCQLCRRRSRDDLLLSHVARTARHVRDRHNAKAVMWEDMLRNMATSSLRAHGVDKLVEPMMWWYTPNVRRYVAPTVWRHAERVYTHVWGAGAYKGAFGSALFVPPVDRHVQNNLDWTELLAEEDGRLRGGVRGLVLTGWSRYDHFATLAELMAVAVPCLAFSLAAVRRGALDDKAAQQAQRALGCSSPQPLSQLHMPYMYQEMERCLFPGQAVYRLMGRFNRTAELAREYLQKLESGQESSWLGEYPGRHNFSSVLRVREELPKLEQQRHMVASLLAPLHRELSAIYQVDIALEWLEHRVYPLLRRLDTVQRRLTELDKQRLFPVRPLRQYPEQFLTYMDQYVRGWRSR